MDTLGRLLCCFGLIVGPTSTSLPRDARTPDASSLVALGTVLLRPPSAENSSNSNLGLQRRDPLHAANGTARVLAISIVSILRCHLEPYTAGGLRDCSPITPTWNPSPGWYISAGQQCLRNIFSSVILTHIRFSLSNRPRSSISP